MLRGCALALAGCRGRARSGVSVSGPFGMRTIVHIERPAQS